MEGIDSINSSLYFQAASFAAANAQSVKKDEKINKTKKTHFSSAIEKAQAENELIQEGFPLELAQMSLDEAVVFLKDEADIAAENVKKHQTQEMFIIYRRKVSQFLRYLEKNNFEIATIKRRGRDRKTGLEKDPYKQIVIINQKLEDIAEWLLHDHKRVFNMLAKVDEIQGLLVDLIAG